MISSRARAWREAGTDVEVGGRRIHLHRRDGRGTPLVIVHGYPGSSFDFAGVVEHLDRPVLLMDLLGYGFSEKPRAAAYSLFEQADLVQELVARAGYSEAALIGHDMGTTVVAELLARSNAGRLGFAVPSATLLNGSIFIDMARLTRGQRLGLLAHGRALPFSFPVAFLRRNLRESIAPGTAVGPEELSDLVELIRLEQGDRLLTRQIDYVRERRRHQRTWTTALVDYPGRLSALWGVLDPIAVPAMPRHLADLRPGTEVRLLEDVGHWPSIEAPETVAAELLRLS